MVIPSIMGELDKLSEDDQLVVLEFARDLGRVRPRGTPGKVLLHFAG